jgi:hypothetical protein
LSDFELLAFLVKLNIEKGVHIIYSYFSMVIIYLFHFFIL